MSDFNRGAARTIPADRADMSVDAGLRSFMLGVYNKVALGLVVSAGLAFLTGSFAPVRDLMFTVSNGRVGYSILGMVVAFAPLAVILFTSFTKNVTPKMAGITAFGALSLAGYTTKKNLNGFGSFLIMGAWGLIGAMLINMFLQSSVMSLLINVVGLLIFAGLTAYDTQRLKMTYYELGGNQSAMSVATNFGALSLYLDFINMFQFLLALLGSRR